ncbi:hypothetical protein KAU11_01405, partial [Candidatus Babeliales bacterium]|nr:hypothetical protein [Candidatus Babeliales bacterium]
MQNEFVYIEPSGPLDGEVAASGAKNAALVIIASLIMAPGKSVLYNVPALLDVFVLIKILEGLGATINFDAVAGTLEVDTSNINQLMPCTESMGKFRASVLIAGSLLARFGKAHIVSPGGCPL